MQEREKITSEILNIIDHADDFTRSDLQSAIDVQVMKAMRLGEDYARKTPKF